MAVPYPPNKRSVRNDAAKIVKLIDAVAGNICYGCGAPFDFINQGGPVLICAYCGRQYQNWIMPQAVYSDIRTVRHFGSDFVAYLDGSSALKTGEIWHYKDGMGNRIRFSDLPALFEAGEFTIAEMEAIIKNYGLFSNPEIPEMCRIYEQERAAGRSGLKEHDEQRGIPVLSRAIGWFKDFLTEGE